MRIVLIALLIFCIQVSAALVNAAGGYAYSITPDEGWFSDVVDGGGGEYTQTQLQNRDVGADFGDFVKSIPKFVGIIVLSIFVIPWLLIQFGLAASIAVIMSLPIYFLYALALAQIIGNRGMKGME